MLSHDGRVLGGGPSRTSGPASPVITVTSTGGPGEGPAPWIPAESGQWRDEVQVAKSEVVKAGLMEAQAVAKAKQYGEGCKQENFVLS